MFGVSLRALLGAAGAAAAVPEGYAAVVLALAPRAWWRFGEAGGVGAVDRMGVAPGLYVGGVTLGRPAVVDDPADPAVRLDGAGGRVEVPHVPALATAAGTFAVALSAEDVQAAQGVWSKGAGVDVSIEGHRVVFRLGGQVLRKGMLFAGRRAHLAWSFGPAGMRLYVDGLLVASNPHAGGLAGNGAALLWGARSGPTSPLKGTLDEGVFFDRQLSDAELRGLARLSRAIPAAAVVRYVAPSGSDSAPGSLAQPWRTVAKAFASANPGDVVVLRGGTYWERDLVCNRSGTAANPITLMAYPGEVPVIDGGYALGRAVANSDWSLVDAGRGIWESANIGAAGNLFGRFKDGASGRWYALLSYKSASHLELTGDAYRGPGVIGANGRVRIRLGKPSLGFTTAALPAEAPANPDPRQNAVLVHPWTRLLRIAASHWIWDGITFQGGEPLIETTDSRSHHGFFRCRFLCSFFSIVHRGGSFWLFDDCEADGGWPDWISWTDVKVGGLISERSKIEFYHVPHNAALVSDLEMRNCLFENFFDVVVIGRNHCRDLHIHHCTADYVRDDFGQNKSTMTEVEIAYNRIIGVGYGWEGTGGTSSSNPGTTWIHHNLVIQTRPQLWEPGDVRFAAPAETHFNGGYGSGAPYKIYHNTIIGRMPNVNGNGCQVQHISSERRNNTGVPHEVLNNIIIAHAKPGDAHAYLMTGAKVKGGGEIFDGNLWFRALEGQVQNPWFWRFVFDIVPQDGGNARTFNSLAAFKADSWFQETRAHYAPGWEAAGVEADPQFVAPAYDDPAAGDWRPQAAAAQGGVGLAGKGWPGLVAGESHKGALRPDGATLLGRQPMA